MLVYLHGFNSSPASHKVTLLRDWLATRGLAQQLRCPALPPHPGDALATIEAAVRDIDPARLTFIGSSLGGFYATHFAEQLGCRAALINPAIRETGDEVLDWREAAASYAGARAVIRDGGDHSLQGFADHLSRILDFARIAQPGT